MNTLGWVRTSPLETKVCVKSSVHVKYIQLSSPVTPINSNSVDTLPLQEEACLCAFPLNEHTPYYKYSLRTQVRWTVRCAFPSSIHLSDCTTKETRDIYIYSALCRENYACKRRFEAASLINCSNAKSMWAHKVSEIENHYLLIFFSMALLSGLLLITRRCTVMFNENTCLRAST